MGHLKKLNHCASCEGRKSGLFCSLKEADLQLIDESKFEHHLKPGQNLFYAGNPATGLYCILSGTVKLESQDESGKGHIVQIFKTGDLIGYRALFSDEPYQSSAVIVEESQICFIPKASVLNLISQNPEVAMKLLMQLSNDFRMMEQRLQRVTSHSTSERIAEALLFLRERFQEKNWTRKEIAEWASTTPETVIRTLADFEDEGIIEQVGRSIKILDRAKLLEKSRIII